MPLINILKNEINNNKIIIDKIKNYCKLETNKNLTYLHP